MTVRKHPVFWEKSTILSFLQDVSDRVEKEDSESKALLSLETGGIAVCQGDWKELIDFDVLQDLGKYRSYRGDSVRDLLRAFRNKKHHYRELSEKAQALLGTQQRATLIIGYKDFHICHVRGGPFIQQWNIVKALYSEVRGQDKKIWSWFASFLITPTPQAVVYADFKEIVTWFSQNLQTDVKKFFDELELNSSSLFGKKVDLVVTFIAAMRISKSGSYPYPFYANQ